MRRLKRFQELGHKIVFIIGDFTGRIGDPSGRSKTRPMLSEEQIKLNGETYAAQVGKILDVSKCEIVYNSSWFSQIDAAGILRLASHYTVARMLERDDFSKRMAAETPISVVEMLYPLVQSYDSVAVKADIELGGTDQLFNFLVGRDIMRAYGLEPQVVMTWPLLVGLDGHDKMSKSLGNYVGISEAPGEMFGKLMSIPDALLPQYLLLVCEWTLAKVAEAEAGLRAGTVNPRELKDEMARTVVATYHGEAAGEEASAEFRRVFSKHELPAEMPLVAVWQEHVRGEKVWLVGVIVKAGMAASNSEARRLLKQGAVSVNDEVVADGAEEVALKGGDVLRVGKRRFGRIVVEG
jgi:tyrosyl-tRNA synthetase